jgi:hypothetical protein
MPCDITLYWDSNYRGRSQNFGSTKGDLNVDPVTVGRNDASSYKVNADESCLITGWTYPGLSADGRSRGRYLRGNEPNFNWRRKWNDNNWNDDLDGVAIHTIPSANSDQMQYHIAINNYTPHSFNDQYCGGCRWWPEVKDRGNYANANRDDVMVREGVTFRPCPGGTGYFNSASGVRCIYSKIDAAGLRVLHSNKNGIQNDPRATMHATLKDTFCSDSENITKDPGGGTCLEFDSAKTIAKDYCSKNNRMATSAVCTKENLGNFYDQLAENYCKTIDPADDWCSCYNVINKVCDTNNSAAGCFDKARTYDSLVEATPEEFKTAWAGLEGCYGGVCQGNKYIVPNANQNCNKPINICKQELDAQNISESSVDMVCNIGDNDDVSGYDGTSGGPREVTFQEGSLQDILDKGVRSKLPFGIGDFIPLSFEDVKYNRNKQVGLGGTFASSFSSVLIIAIIITLLATTGTKRRIFRG